MSNIQLYNGDCLKVMDNLIQQGIKVDAIITDLPYGQGNCSWDTVIPFDELWKRFKILRYDNTPIILFGNEPFSSNLRLSNIKEYKYDLIWHKSKTGSALLAKQRPMYKHENISIFYKKQPTYNPQMLKGKPYERHLKYNENRPNNHNWGIKNVNVVNNGTRYPESVIFFQQKWRRQDQIHPTQKPVELLEWLIKTYTNENDLVIDATMGSGTTGVACKNTNRNFIGIELDENYFNIAKERIENV